MTGGFKAISRLVSEAPPRRSRRKKTIPAGMAASRLRTVSAWPSGTVSGFLLSADFADFRRLVLSILYLPSSASSADLLFGFWSKPGLLREWAAALGQTGMRGAVSALVSGRDFDTFFCVRVFLFDAVA